MRINSKISSLSRTWFLASCLSGLFAWASWAVPDLKPEWAQSVTNQRINGSFLMDLNPEVAGIPTGPFGLPQQIMDPDYGLAKRREFEDLTRSYQIRKQYDLLRPEEERAHYEELSRFSKSAIQDVGNFQLRRKMDRAKNAAKNLALNDPLLQKLKKPAAVVAAVAALYTGAEFKFNLTHEMELMANPNVRERKAALHLINPYVDTSVDFFGKAPGSRDPYASIPEDPEAREERYRFSLTRGLPILDISSQVSYGTTTRKMTASLSKQLMQNLSCSVDASRNMGYEPVEGRNGEENVRFAYGFKF